MASHGGMAYFPTKPSSDVKIKIPRVANTTKRPRKQRRKSRFGCLTCKRKRLKCDETRPSCDNCYYRNVECEGYPEHLTNCAQFRNEDVTTVKRRAESQKAKSRRPSGADPEVLELVRPKPSYATPLLLLDLLPESVGTNGLDVFFAFYENWTASTVSILRETANPWCQLILPIARPGTYLGYALCGMTAHHLGYYKEGIEFTSMSIAGVQKAIGAGQKDELLVSAVMCLGWIEIWDTLVSNGIHHIEACGRLLQCNPNKRSDLWRFLNSMWVYQGAIATLARREPVELNRLDTSGSEVGEGCQALQCTYVDVDPILGTAGWLFVNIPRIVSAIFSYKRNPNQSNFAKVIDLYHAVLAWVPPRPANRNITDPQEDQAIFLTSVCYRYAALLFMYTHMPSLIPPDEVYAPQRISNKILRGLGSIPETSRTIVIHIWPLVEAGCYSTSISDREFVQSRLKAMHQRLQLGNILKGAELVRDVWRRIDQGSSMYELAGWRGVMFDRDWNLFLG